MIRSGARTATAGQNAALAEGYTLATAVRTAVVRRGASPEVQQGYGVGAKTATKERNRTANRILEAVDVLVGAGVLDFAKDPAVRGSSRRW